MPLRAALFANVASVIGLLMPTPPAQADSSGRELASYYERHMALQGDVAHEWIGRGEPQRMRAGVVQVGVSRDAYFALLADGTLTMWSDAPAAAATLMREVASFAAGATGWFAFDRAGVLWHGAGSGAPRRVAEGVVAASDVLTVKAHTGHAIHLRRDGVVMGTGGNRFGPLSSHGLGDTTDRWGRVFDSAVAIATGSRHSLALRADGSLWAWGEGFKGEPAKLLDAVVAVAAGDTATLARWHARSMARCGNGTAAVHHAGWCCVSRFQRGGQRTGRLGAPALGKRTLALSRRLAAMGATRIFRHEDYELACTASVDDSGKFVPAVAVAVAKQAWPRRPRNIAVPRGEYVTEEDAARAQGIDWIANYG